MQPTKSDTDDDGDSISKIQDELTVLNNHINQLNIKRRQILNEFLDLKGNIRVFCRIRPIAFGENLDEVFTEVEPIIKSVIDGYNACIFAYGQTGTGKTFTMSPNGTHYAEDKNSTWIKVFNLRLTLLTEGSADTTGIVPRAIEALFKQAVDCNHAFLISFSMLEIYMGHLKDLLVPKPTKATDPMPPWRSFLTRSKISKYSLSIQTDPKGGIEIDNLVAIKVNDFNQALRLYRLGCRFRTTASTNSNLTSSRSHW
ncbi:hypothetical protein NC653_000113 [Populus alba x Populus x berolinensis]|uniref:Kinesin motor domain-containing protein n=1 Tax=Populus alba x Populus x berolinensis TaxID=444605 RepID=A0AAD6RIJ5_9ROSI|nr:hypothetical protein NC653_000113 [Populus alba x Populus x berolinensis]